MGVSAFGYCAQRATEVSWRTRRGDRPCKFMALRVFLLGAAWRSDELLPPLHAAGAAGGDWAPGQFPGQVLQASLSASGALLGLIGRGPCAWVPVGGPLEAFTLFPLQPDLWPQLPLSLLVQLTEQNFSEARNCSQRRTDTRPLVCLADGPVAHRPRLLLAQPAQPCLQQLLTRALLLLGYKSLSEVGDNRGFPAACGGLSHPFIWAPWLVQGSAGREGRDGCQPTAGLLALPLGNSPLPLQPLEVSGQQALSSLSPPQTSFPSRCRDGT